jgi:hypothetical protein
MAMAMAPASTLSCYVAHLHHCPPPRAVMHSFRYFHRGHFWPAAQRLPSLVRSSGSWSVQGAGASKRRARGPIMAAAKKAAGEGEWRIQIDSVSVELKLRNSLVCSQLPVVELAFGRSGCVRKTWIASLVWFSALWSFEYENFSSCSDNSESGRRSL